VDKPPMVSQDHAESEMALSDPARTVERRPSPSRMQRPS